MTVLNPFRRVDEHIMDDADLYGPLIFCFCFATFLLFVSISLSFDVALRGIARGGATGFIETLIMLRVSFALVTECIRRVSNRTHRGGYL